MGVSIYQYADGSEYWAVEHIDPTDDGLVEKAIFTGPNAARQAADFAKHEYGFVSEPQHQPV